MTVAELIARLAKLPQDAAVGYVWDGHIRTLVGQVWLTRGPVAVDVDEPARMVALGDSSEYVYDVNEAPEHGVTVQHGQWTFRAGDRT